MANLARSGARSPKVKDYVERIQFPEAIDDTLRGVYQYRDEAEEIVRTPEFMLHDLETLGYIEGDCDDIATLAASLVKAMNVPARLTAIMGNSQTEFDHVFTEFHDGAGWVPIDLTVQPGTTYQYYGITSEFV